MAKYSKQAGKKVEESMHEFKQGTLKSGSGAKVKSRKQAIAIGLSEAREKGAKVPRKKSSKKATRKKSNQPGKGIKKKAAKKKSGKSGVRKGATKSKSKSKNRRTVR